MSRQMKGPRIGIDIACTEAGDAVTRVNMINIPKVKVMKSYKQTMLLQACFVLIDLSSLALGDC